MKRKSLESVFDNISNLLTSHKKIVVGFSGGMDSHVLLHILATLSKRKSQIIALHVDHNVSPNAKKWSSHCKRICKKLNIEYVNKIVNSEVEFNKCSPEEISRNLRYDIFSKFLPKGGCLLTAHHANDQAETLLLQLFRGSGPKGLAAMPIKTKFGKGWLARPMINCLREYLLQYAKENKLKWIEDESNIDIKFDRNFIRHKLMPKIQKRWPGIINALNRSAKNCAEADQLLEILAEKDLSSFPCVPDTSIRGQAFSWNLESINIKPLKKLSNARQKNVIRFWLRKQSLTLPSEIKMREILEGVIGSRYDAVPVVTWKTGEVRRFRNNIYAMLPLKPHDNKKVLFFSEKKLKLPGDLGVLKIKSLPKGDMDIKKIKVCFRKGGEKIVLLGRNGTRDLKKIMQEWNIPPWQRDRIPLIYHEDCLISIVGYYNDNWIDLFRYSRASGNSFATGFLWES